MEPTRSSYVEYGAGNMLNLDVGTIKRKIESNEYDDDNHQEVQPNGKRACNSVNQFSRFDSLNGNTVESTFDMPSPSPLLRTPMNGHQSQCSPSSAQSGHHTPDLVESSMGGSPAQDYDMDLGDADIDHSMTMGNSHSLLPSHYSGHADQQQAQLQLQAQLQQQQQQQPQQSQHNMTEYVPIHGRSMEIPSYARVPLSEMKKYRDQRWSSCIYGADTRIGHGMML